jgi:hypothetical protein
MRVCAACGDDLPITQVYFRFAVVVEGELDVLDDGAPDAANPQAIADRMESDDFGRYEDDVHWEANGVMCARCRAKLLALLAGRSVGAH